MKHKNLKIIILDDFSNCIETAFRFVANLNNALSFEIILLHIIDKENIAKMEKSSISMEMLIQNLQKRGEMFSKQFNFHISPKIEQGNIFEAIPKIAFNEKVDFVLFSTSGITFFQKLIGSNALRLIEKSSVPIAIVHANSINPIEKIVTNTESDSQNIIDLFDFSINQVEKLTTQTKLENALLLYEIPKSAFLNKDEQKSIDQIIFNNQNAPIVCWKSEY